jgi:hypothetical protein
MFSSRSNPIGAARLLKHCLMRVVVPLVAEQAAHRVLALLREMSSMSEDVVAEGDDIRLPVAARAAVPLSRHSTHRLRSDPRETDSIGMRKNGSDVRRAAPIHRGQGQLPKLLVCAHYFFSTSSSSRRISPRYCSVFTHVDAGRPGVSRSFNDCLAYWCAISG